MTLKQYITNINNLYQAGNATEHSYRSDLQQLLENLLSNIKVVNEPKRQACGAPDYILYKNDDIPVGFIEAKDIGDQDLEGKKKNKEQFQRYKKALDNLIITDYLNFHFYKDEQWDKKIAIAQIVNGEIIALENNFSQFESCIKDFVFNKKVSQTIKLPKDLASKMAGKAKLIADIILKAINEDSTKKETELWQQYKAFKEILIHDITTENFADVYAQTIAYGMFVARLHDRTLKDFSRYEASELIPKSNPFLKSLFTYIAAVDLDERIKWVIDNLIKIFLACNVWEVLHNYGTKTKQEDPVIHFYETFLAEYDPKLRKARGVWYTPQPVVGFIVRSLDEILKSEFGLKQGLADTSKTKVKCKVGQTTKKDQDSYQEIEFHKVQILDPATGTGTFLAQVVEQIYKKFENQKGIWQSYVKNDLIPRLNGFELLMASYAMAHLKLDILFKETGCEMKDQQERLQIFLTNSLEKHYAYIETAFASWLSKEANEANRIKRDCPVMCILGNPPYSGESANKGKWIMELMQDYKKEPGGKDKLNERNPKWINDDYCKFIRYGQHFIEKNGTGVLAFINPHGFLDNPTFRGMRWHLLKTYDKIYTIDLHGNAKKKETCPDGSKDDNVFDIEQGVSINFFIKTGEKKTNELGQVFHYDLYGKREVKYDFLNANSIKTVDYTKLPNKPPMYFMVQKDFAKEEEYKKNFSVNELFPVNNVGIVTARDKFVVDNNKENLKKKIKDFFILDKEEIQTRYSLKENQSWNINQIKKLEKEFKEKDIQKINYRPFDEKYLYYNNSFIERSRTDVMQHFLQGENVGLVFKLGNPEENSSSIHITKSIIDFRSWSRAGMQGGDYIAPLYLYHDDLLQTKREPNFDAKIIAKFAKGLGLSFTVEKQQDNKTFAPIDILDYIYAVLHSPTYRKKYKEFLKIDFPRVPYPKNATTFWRLVKLGGELRQIHLLESQKVEEFITSYPKAGTNIITRKLTKTDLGYEASDDDRGRVWINDEQFFDDVPLIAWEFFIGGYQPAQKWLKDRKDQELSCEDIFHYQKIIVALTQTHRLMQQIDKLEVE